MEWGRADDQGSSIVTVEPIEWAMRAMVSWNMCCLIVALPWPSLNMEWMSRLGSSLSHKPPLFHLLAPSLDSHSMFRPSSISELESSDAGDNCSSPMVKDGHAEMDASIDLFRSESSARRKKDGEMAYASSYQKLLSKLWNSGGGLRCGQPHRGA